MKTRAQKRKEEEEEEEKDTRGKRRTQKQQKEQQKKMKQEKKRKQSPSELEDAKRGEVSKNICKRCVRLLWGLTARVPPIGRRQAQASKAQRR